MTTIAILPARMGSTRFPGKPLKNILGIPMIGHCYYRTKMCKKMDDVYVATCDQEIFDYVVSIGGKAVMTSNSHERATDRTAEAMKKIEQIINKKLNYVAMVQGDEPLLTPEMLTDSLDQFVDQRVEVVNVMCELHSDKDYRDTNNVKVAINIQSDALYFSREPIPSAWKGTESIKMLMQLGIISFKRDYLLKFNELSQTPLEKIESVDMNRVLEHGGRVRMILSNSRSIGVDTEDDLNLVESIMKSDVLYSEYSSKL